MSIYDLLYDAINRNDKEEVKNIVIRYPVECFDICHGGYYFRKDINQEYKNLIFQIHNREKIKTVMLKHKNEEQNKKMVAYEK